MPNLCLFCDNNAGNREHLWPKWIHDRIDFGPLKMDRYKSQQIIIPNPEITVKSVCARCNNGWMSSLEAKNIPIIGSMLNDLSITLDRDAQETVAAWVIKTAMMLDSTRPKAAGARFYRRDDCGKMRDSQTMPDDTRVWIGRIDSKHLLGLGTDYRYLQPDTNEPHGQSTITTLVAGHFVAQSITQRKFKKFTHLEMPVLYPKGDGWEEYVTQIWPIEREWIAWPAENSFTNGGPDGIAYLMDRWRVGQQVDPSVLADMPS
jgi:hypothetical protein